MSKQPLSYYQADPERYVIGSNGSVYDREIGAFCDMISEMNPYSLDRPGRAAAMVERRRQIGQISQLRGLALAAGVDLDEATLEEIAQGAGTAVEKMTKHMFQVFMKSSNVRGLAEAYRALIAPMIGEKEERKVSLNYYEHTVSQATYEMLHKLQEAVEGQVVNNDDIAP